MKGQIAEIRYKDSVYLVDLTNLEFVIYTPEKAGGLYIPTESSIIMYRQGVQAAFTYHGRMADLMYEAFQKGPLNGW